MKRINNQDVLLRDELLNNLNGESEVQISSNYFTTFALFDLIEELNNAKSIQILLNFTEMNEADFSFIQDEIEKQLNISLDRKHKINQVIDLIDSNVEIRNGHVGNQNIILVTNGDIANCYMITPLNLNSISLGT